MVTVPTQNWVSPGRFRVPLKVDLRGVDRSHSPASLDIDFRKLLKDLGVNGTFDEHTVEVIAFDSAGEPRVFDASREGYEKYLLPHRVDTYFGANHVTLSFAIPDNDCAAIYCYFDTVESGRGKPERYAGLVGDGDWFHIGYGRREIGASHMDCFCDFSGSGRLDLFKCTNEPYIYCYENVGGNKLVSRGRLASGGKVFTFPHNKNFRSWPVITFHDWNGDGRMDLFASFSDGPDHGHVVCYENTTKPGGQLTLENRGRILSESGKAIGDGWFASVTPIDYDGDGKTDLVVGDEGHLDFYRNIGDCSDPGKIRIADAVPIELKTEALKKMRAPRAEFADMDGDGDLDLILATQGGGLYYFENIGTRTKPVYAEPVMLPNCSGGHDGVKVADFDGCGRPEYVMSSVWSGVARLYKNAGTLKEPKWEEKDASNGCPYTECVQRCDAARQNTVRVVDWDNDGNLDLLVSGERRTVQVFRNTTNNLSPKFADGVVIIDEDHAGIRSCVCDWNSDGKKDIVTTNWSGAVMLYLNKGTDSEPVFGKPIELKADGKSFTANMWPSVLICDWDGDGKKDLIFGMAGEGRNEVFNWPQLNKNPALDQGFLFYRNIGADEAPEFGRPEWIQVADEGKKSFDYLRPNAGAFVDWDGDGKKDLIVAEFENAIHFYRNIGSGKPGEIPKLDKGVMLIRATTDQIISGVDVVDWNGDGRLDIVTGQGHGGSGIRYFTRDFIEDGLKNTHPIVKAGEPERRG